MGDSGTPSGWTALLALPFQFASGVMGKSAVVLVALYFVLGTIGARTTSTYVEAGAGIAAFVAFVIWLPCILHHVSKYPNTGVMDGAAYAAHVQAMARTQELPPAPSAPVPPPVTEGRIS